MSALLEARNVVSGYGGAKILHDLSLSISLHDRVALLGRNGVGKTTFVNTIVGIAKLFSGQVEFAGKAQQPVRYFDAARCGIAVVPQGRRIISNLSVRENLILGAAVGRPGRWDLEAVFQLFPVLRERAERPGTALSGGQQQMLAIGRALMANPQLMILDEPSEGLAPVIVDELASVLNMLASTGTSLLVIEQNYGLVSRVTDRYYVLSKGSIVEEGKMAGLSIDSLKKHVAV